LTIENLSTDGGALTVYGVAKNLTDQVTFSLPNGLPFTFPLVLPAGASKSFLVSFKPSAVQKYIDTIIFTHNAGANPANDSIGIVKGEGIEGSLAATSHDWGRKRVQSGPFLDSVTVTNVGTADVLLKGIKSKTGDVTDFTVLNEATLNNLNLTPNQS